MAFFHRRFAIWVPRTLGDFPANFHPRKETPRHSFRNPWSTHAKLTRNVRVGRSLTCTTPAAPRPRLHSTPPCLEATKW